MYKHRNGTRIKSENGTRRKPVVVDNRLILAKPSRGSGISRYQTSTVYDRNGSSSDDIEKPHKSSTLEPNRLSGREKVYQLKRINDYQANGIERPREY